MQTTLPPDSPPAVRLIEIDAEHAGQRLDNYLMRVCKGVPKSHVYKMVRSGQLRVNRGRVGVDYRLEAGDIVRVPPLRLPATNERVVPPAAFPVVYEDDALLVIDKPAGVAAHGGSGVSFGVIEQLRAAHPDAKFLELVHRLDRDTSGLMMLARKRSALVQLHAAMRDGNTRKEYLLLVVGDWQNERQHLRAPLLKWTTRTGERRVRVDPEGQSAHTIVTLERRFGPYSLVRAELRTGRTHQIRVHLADAGFPLVGDDKYGLDEVNATMAKTYGFRRMFLHAERLGLAHPLTGARLQLHAPLPPVCTQLLATLEANKTV